jgi:hypothetical protein
MANLITFILATIMLVAGMTSFIVIFGLVMSLPVMLLWDWIMPTIFGLTKITWLQAWGLLILCGLLFKSGVTNKKA